MKKLIILLAFLAVPLAHAGESLILRADNGQGTVVTITTEQCVDREIIGKIAAFNTLLASSEQAPLDANEAMQGTVLYQGTEHKACWVLLPDGAGVFTVDLVPFPVPASAFVKVEQS